VDANEFLLIKQNMVICIKYCQFLNIIWRYLLMKLWAVLLLIPVFTLCACGTSTDSTAPYTEISESIAMEPVTPSKEITHEERVKNVTNALSTIQSLYEKMQTSAAQNNAPKKAIKNAAKVEKQYGERIKELTALSLTDLSDDELKELSFELSEIVSAIRSVNDLF